MAKLQLESLSNPSPVLFLLYVTVFSGYVCVYNLAHLPDFV